VKHVVATTLCIGIFVVPHIIQVLNGYFVTHFESLNGSFATSRCFVTWFRFRALCAPVSVNQLAAVGVANETVVLNEEAMWSSF
jgi:phosphate/sulfate permease